MLITHLNVSIYIIKCKKIEVPYQTVVADNDTCITKLDLVILMER